MMNKKKTDALEIICRNVLELGMDAERCLAEFPDFADELRPLLDMAINAKAAAPAPVPADISRRGRAHLLQQAAQMREEMVVQSDHHWLFGLQRLAVPALVALVFLVSGTGLLRASASALPGDGLYGVKRGWENAHFLFAGDEKAASLRVLYEEERREEVQMLLDNKRVTAVQFEGIVTSQTGSMWHVANVPVGISSNTKIGTSIIIGSDVVVNGETQDDGVVLASQITLSLPIETLVPSTDIEDASSQQEDGVESAEDVIDTPESEFEDQNSEEQPTEDVKDHNDESATETPEPEIGAESDTNDTSNGEIKDLTETPEATDESDVSDDETPSPTEIPDDDSDAVVETPQPESH